ISQRPAWDKYHPSDLPGILTDLNKALGRRDAVKRWAALRIPGNEKRVELLRKQLPRNAESFLVTSRGLCHCYADTGRNAEAVKLCAEALGVFKSLDETPAYQALPLVSYRNAVTKAGRPDLAIEMTTILLAALRNRPGAPELMVAGDLCELGFPLSAPRRDAE